MASDAENDWMVQRSGKMRPIPTIGEASRAINRADQIPGSSSANNRHAKSISTKGRTVIIQVKGTD